MHIHMAYHKFFQEFFFCISIWKCCKTRTLGSDDFCSGICKAHLSFFMSFMFFYLENWQGIQYRPSMEKAKKRKSSAKTHNRPGLLKKKKKKKGSKLLHTQQNESSTRERLLYWFESKCWKRPVLPLPILVQPFTWQLTNSRRSEPLTQVLGVLHLCYLHRMGEVTGKPNSVLFLQDDSFYIMYIYMHIDMHLSALNM